MSGRAGEDLSLECVSEGGNPAPVLSWRVGDERLQPTLEQDDRVQQDGRWSSVSRLQLPVSSADNGAKVECVVEHPALEEPTVSSINLEIFFPPKVEIRTSSPNPLTEGQSVTLSCEVESNPPARVTWRRLGAAGSSLVGSNPTLILDPVRREDAGTYHCSAENELGLSKPQTVSVEVHCEYPTLSHSNYLSHFPDTFSAQDGFHLFVTLCHVVRNFINFVDSFS